MKTVIYTTDGKPGKEISLPSFFSTKVREDLIQKIIEAKKNIQPYGPMPGAGSQYSASGKLNHRRKVWKSQYGRGMSRIPRKQMSRKGSQFNWVGATVPNTRGGRRAHPPKVISMINLAKINKKELKLALMSAISASANEKYIQKKYNSLENEKIGKVPFVVETKFVSLKIKDILNLLKKILGEQIFEVSIQKRSIRAGIGKLRGRKYKSSAGMIFVIGNKEKLKTSHFDVQNVSKLSVEDLAKGGVGRIVVYTEQAISELSDRFTSSPKSQTKELEDRFSEKIRENKLIEKKKETKKKKVSKKVGEKKK